MFETEIIRIPVLPFGAANAHLVRNAATCILVDAGPAGSERRIARVLARHGLSLRDIKLIVLTHGHADHAGNAARLRDLSGAPILAHEGDAHLYCQKRATAHCPASGVSGLFRKATLPEEPYRGFEPDITMMRGEQINLLDFAIDGIVHHTGGHTPGSIVVELASHDVMAGGLIASRALMSGTVVRPASEADPQGIVRELERLVERDARRFHLGHGGPLDRAGVLRHLKALAKAGLSNA
jgi:hydroxyacylglutathione hydrolase